MKLSKMQKYFLAGYLISLPVITCIYIGYEFNHIDHKLKIHELNTLKTNIERNYEGAKVDSLIKVFDDEISSHQESLESWNPFD